MKGIPSVNRKMDKIPFFSLRRFLIYLVMVKHILQESGE